MVGSIESTIVPLRDLFRCLSPAALQCIKTEPNQNGWSLSAYRGDLGKVRSLVNPTHRGCMQCGRRVIQPNAQPQQDSVAKLHRGLPFFSRKNE